MTENTNSLTRATGAEWMKFLKFLSLGAGAGFLLSGIIFFFAYNWSEMHRFTKFGIVGALMLACYGGIFLSKKNETIQNTLITAMSVIVGVMIALYGQIYQLEADSYVMFYTWGLGILVWAIVADFYPLWLILIGLLFTGICLQEEHFWHLFHRIFSYSKVFLIAVTGLFWALPHLLPERKPAPNWFMVVLFAALLIASMDFREVIIVQMTILPMLYFFGTTQRNMWVYSMFFMGLIILLIRLFYECGIFDAGIFLLIGASIIVALVFISKHLIEKNKEWRGKDGNK